MARTASNIPLKLEGTNGDFQQYNDSAEENFLAYRAGLKLSTIANTSVSRINTSGSGDDAIGTFTNTFFADSVGDPVGSTTTENQIIYQKSGTASLVDSDGFRRPVAFVNDKLQEMADSDTNILVDRLNKIIHANDYPGTYKLATSAPSGDYAAAHSNVFTDTRADGNTVNYSIWKRTAMSAPSTVKYVRLKGTPQDEGLSFSGIQEATLSQIGYSLGKIAQNRIMATSIGSYLLRTGTQGAPTVTGTWVAKGTATDTKQTTADANYTRNSQRDSTVTYEGNYEGNYVGAFTDYLGAFTRDSTRNSQRNSTDDFIGNYTGNYDAVFDGAAFTRNSTDDFVGNYTGNYDGAYDGAAFTRNSTQDFLGNYTGQYTGNYEGADSTRNSTDDFVGNYTGNYTGNYDGADSTRDST